MNWESQTSTEPHPAQSLRQLTPVEANAIMGEFYVSLLSEQERISTHRNEILKTKLNDLMGADRPIETLVKTFMIYAQAFRGDAIGDMDVHMRRLANAWNVIGRAKCSENANEKTLATQLEHAIGVVLPQECSKGAQR